MKNIELEIFSDETYIFNKKYVGIGCLFVPKDNKLNLVNKLKSSRCLNNENPDYWIAKQDNCKMFKNGSCKKQYHKYNDCEIHYNGFRKGMSYSQKEITNRWIDILLDKNRQRKETEKIYFNILYLDMEKLDTSFFGEDKTGNNVYNRFYKTTILGPLKSFFGKNSNITIKEIFHDISDDKRTHEYFTWHTPVKLNDEKRIKVNKELITFIDSDHKNYKPLDPNFINSHYIQFIDLILGSISYAIFKESNDKEKMQLYEKYYPLIKRLWNHPNNPNSSFNYYKSQQVSIFPKEKVTYQMDIYGNKIRNKGKFHRDIKLIQPKYTTINHELKEYFN
ncbi:hypothetical protein [uncultured Methanobrevibacter sp.]|uniref:hypothetical protein n=1 Tax=uncultured Methanobrevibacter sp. TaxID=253161 RepID=UPI0025E7536F|nr:hypothetical protein [uncultured Methanobrevibacter sp.]